MTRIFDATRDLKELADLAANPRRMDEVLTHALEGLQNLVPHDLAAVLRLDGDTLEVLAARGPLAGDQVRAHRLDLAEYPTIRRVLDNRRPVILNEDDHTGDEKDPYHNVLDLPHDHSCMVVPLYSGGENLGVMTFDRTVCGTYDQTVMELADAYGRIISLAMRYAQQSELLERYRRLLDERHRVLVGEANHESEAGALMENTRSPLVQDLVRQARQVAVADTPVLILGETGTGKEVLAQALHGWSPRASEPFLKINCAAIPENLIESELFGHVPGAFTGASRARPGRFLAANGGTLLLDEIGDMPSAAQAKLLRVLQEGTFEPVGSDSSVKVDVRIIAATHRDLSAHVAAGKFREDLMYRLDVFPLVLPPLRERPEDLTLLATRVLEGIARRTGRGPWILGPGAEEVLQTQGWPGNVRQLVNTLERATILKPRGRLDARFFGSGTGGTVRREIEPIARREPEILSMEEMERQHLRRALQQTEGKIYGKNGAAQLLGLKPTTLQSRMKKLGVDRSRS